MAMTGLTKCFRSGRGGQPVELSTSRTTAWARLQPAADSCLRWAFQPRAWLSLEQVLQQMPGTLIDCFGLAIVGTAVQDPGETWPIRLDYLTQASVLDSDVSLPSGRLIKAMQIPFKLCFSSKPWQVQNSCSGLPVLILDYCFLLDSHPFVSLLNCFIAYLSL